MKKLFTLCISALICFTLSTQAQKIRLAEGDISALKSEPSINVEFTYDGMGVGKFADEKDYLAKKTEEYNKKEPGRGDEWAKKWVSDRKNEFEPKFIELFEKYSDMKIKTDSKYTMIFRTKFTEPGWNVYVSRRNAEIDAEVTIVETNNRTKQIAKITVDNAPGRTFGGYDFETAARISEAYAISGKKLAKFFKKED